MHQSLINKILTKEEINGLDINNDLIKFNSCPYIINRNLYINICKSYLCTVFLFFSCLIIIIVLILIDYKIGLYKCIALIIYIYLSVFLYIELLTSNTIKCGLEKRYNIHEIRERIYKNFITNSSNNDNSDNNDNKVNYSNNSDNNNENHSNSKQSKRLTYLRKSENQHKNKEKLFSNEKYTITDVEDNKNYSIKKIKEFDEINYNLDELKNVNDLINFEILKYIQFENNNYTINNRYFDIFLVVSGIISQLNIFCDLLFIYFLYNFCKILFIISLFIYAYYVIHFFILIKFSILIIISLLKLHKKGIIHSVKNKFSALKQGIFSFYYSTWKVIKNFCRKILVLHESIEIVNRNEYKPFFNKYTNYNSWCLFYKKNDNINYEQTSSPLRRNLAYARVNKKQIYTSDVKIRKENEKRVRGMSSRNKSRDKKTYDKALLPSHVQMVANMYYFLSQFYTLNIVKSKTLSDYNMYSHINYTIVVFVCKMLYMDIVLCLFKILILFYSEQYLIITLFLFVSIINILITYIINLLDPNSLNTINQIN